MKNPTEYDYIVRETLISCDGFVSRAAKVLGVPPGSLYYNLSTQRQRAWWDDVRKKLFSPKVRAQKRSRRWYVAKRMRLAAEAGLSPKDGGPNG